MDRESRNQHTAGQPRIVTVGISPCWDITCRVKGISWGDHARMDSQQCLPAGKALNVSRALAWMGVPNVAAGLWGRDDHATMTESIAEPGGLIEVHLTPVAGQTRKNLTIVDTQNAREMHLRAPAGLATADSLRALADDLEPLADRETICVFSGALPEGPLLEDVAAIIGRIRGRGARVVIDTAQKPLKRLVQLGDIQMIKPNLLELSQLVDPPVADDPQGIVSAARSIKGTAVVLVSRGPAGAIVVRGEEAFSGAVRRRLAAVNTVGCGDWLLAGFLSRQAASLEVALERALKAATAKAWGWHESMTWDQAAAAINVDVAPVVE